MNDDALALRFGAGPVKRIEDPRLLTGAGRFTDDAMPARAAHMAVLRSPHAHARILSIDTAEASAAPGVLLVLTGAELAAEGIGPVPYPAPGKGPGGGPMAAPPRLPLAVEAVRHVGDGVAVVIAETRAQAQDAADLIAVEYDPLPAVATLDAALAPDAPLVWPAATGNVAGEIAHGDAAAVDAAFAAAAHVTRLRIVNQRLVAAPMEPRASVAEYDPATEHFTIRLGSQNPALTRRTFAEVVLKVPADKVRLLVEDIGGGFGNKSHFAVEDVIAAVAARRVGRPVKWRGDRSDEFLSANQGRDQVADAELAFDAAGRILALRATVWGNLGGYIATSGAIVPMVLVAKVITGVYAIPAIHLRVVGVLTNTTPTGAYRGAGRPEGQYIIERLMDRAARELGQDPDTLRRRNMIPAAAMPFRTALGEVYDSGDFAGMMDRALAAADWAGFPARKAESGRRGLIRGRGFTTYIEWTGGSTLVEEVRIEVHGDGRIVLLSGTQAMGQGIATTYAQMAAARLGVPIERIAVVQGDTDRVAGAGSVGSRSLFVGGAGVVAGVEAAVDKGKLLAADALEAAPGDIGFAAGRFTILGTDRGIGLFELAARQPQAVFLADGTGGATAPSWPNGCHVCEVEIDPDTGVTRVVRYLTVDDCGQVMNAMLVEGQVHGGIAQGIGQALLEDCRHDAESGQLLSASFMDYAMPRADDMPPLAVTLDPSQPCRTNPLGAKGAGEIGAVAAPPAVMAAVLDALAPFGITDMDMPATPLKVWTALQTAKRT